MSYAKLGGSKTVLRAQTNIDISPEKAVAEEWLKKSRKATKQAFDKKVMHKVINDGDHVMYYQYAVSFDFGGVYANTTKPREFVTRAIWKRVNKNRYIISYSDWTHPDMPTSNHHILGSIRILIIYDRVKNKNSSIVSTKLSYLLQCDFKGLLPTKVITNQHSAFLEPICEMRKKYQKDYLIDEQMRNAVLRGEQFNDGLIEAER